MAPAVIWFNLKILILVGRPMQNPEIYHLFSYLRVAFKEYKIIFSLQN